MERENKSLEKTTQLFEYIPNNSLLRQEINKMIESFAKYCYNHMFDKLKINQDIKKFANYCLNKR